MLRKQKTRAWLLSLAAVVLLMSNVYVGRAEEEPFEIVWQKDIGFGIEFYPFNSGNLSDNPIALSDKKGNFVIYRDSTNSLTVLNLITGEFVKRLIIENSEIEKIELKANNTKIVVYCSDRNFYIFDSINWKLEKKVESIYSYGILSDDLSTIVYGDNSFYDFITKEFKFKINIDNGLSNGIGKKVLLSKNLKKILFLTWSSYTPHESQPIYATLVQVYDIQSKKQLFRTEYEDLYYALANDDISNVFVINTKTGNLENFDLKNNGLMKEIYFSGSDVPPIKLSKNQKYLYSCYVTSEENTIYANPVIKNYDYYDFSDGGIFADIGDDYIIGWIPSPRSSKHTNELVKIQIKDQKLVPVQDISNETEILYPNPVNAIVHISNVHLQNINEIKVIDEKGCDFSKMCTVTLLPDGVDLNLQKLNTGIYFIQVSNYEFSKTYKVIKC